MTGPLVVGLSYRTAPLDLLERAALDAIRCRLIESRLCAGDHIGEAVVLSTCNRLEVYSWVGRFHGGLAAVSEALAQVSGLALPQLSDHLYVHYEDAAVQHVFSVAAGLDSMAIGEQQILGQVRSAMRAAQHAGTLSGSLAGLLQQALRVGKRVHAETDIDRAGVSLVEAGLTRARAVLGDLGSAHALVLGAGAMSGLAVATLRRFGIGSVTVSSRTVERARRLASAAGGTARDLADLDELLAEADVVLACAGAAGHLVTAGQAKGAAEVRGGRAQVYLDLALPRDVEPSVADLDGATVIDLDHLGQLLATTAGARTAVARARALLDEEMHAYLQGRRSHQVAPTVAALRGMAADVVAAELDRMRSRLADRADDRVIAELEQAVHRVVEKLLHTPTVRVKELATHPDGAGYAEALRELFGLDLSHVAEVSRAVITPGAGPAGPGGATP